MKTLRLVIWDFVQRSLNFSQVALCLTKFKSEVESSRTHFEVHDLEAQVLGFEAYKHGRIVAQKDLWEHQTFARKMTLNFARKVIGFSVQIKVTSKKKGLQWNWDGLMNIKLPKILTQTCPKNMKLPKILIQYCPNNIKLPKISTL